MKPDYKYDFKSDAGSAAAQKETSFQAAETPTPLANASHGASNAGDTAKKGKK